MRGRKPKPIALKKLAGNPGKRPLGDEPQPPVPDRAPYTPRHLSDEAKREWRRIITVLIDLGLYTEMDRAALAMYCQAWGRWVKAERELAGMDLVLTPDDGEGRARWNPWLRVSDDAWEQMRKILAEFGLSPSSRSRLAVNTKDGESSLAEVLFGAINNEGTG